MNEKPLGYFFAASLIVLFLFAGGQTQPTGIPSAAISFNTVKYTWPSADGGSTQMLKTNGSGTLSWGVTEDKVGTQSRAQVIQYGSTSTTWYTLLNVASGSGYLDEVMVSTVHTDADIDWGGLGCDIRINVDSAGYQTLSSFALTNFALDDAMTGFHPTDNDTFSSRRIIIPGGARFDSSLAVQMRQTGSSRDLSGVAFYRLDQ